MKRLLIALFMLGLVITACSSSNEVKPSSADAVRELYYPNRLTSGKL